jgi:hypothetical protein
MCCVWQCGGYGLTRRDSLEREGWKASWGANERCGENKSKYVQRFAV